MHSEAHIRYRARISSYSSLHYEPKTVLSRLHRLAKDSQIFGSHKLPNPANAFPHNLTCKPVLAIGDLEKETWLNLLRGDHYVQRTYKNYANKKFIPHNSDISEYQIIKANLQTQTVAFHQNLSILCLIVANIINSAWCLFFFYIFQLLCVLNSLPPSNRLIGQRKDGFRAENAPIAET